MGRRKRPHAPVMIFHLFSMLHRREPLFVPGLRDEIASLIGRMVGRTDAELLAFAVMPNHVHIVLRQGETPLGEVVQPLMRRIAYRVQRRHGRQGAVFERRYRDRICQTPDHAREVLMYVHLNPWRAGLCGEDLAYRWTTHATYLPDADPAKLGIDPAAQLAALELFAQSERPSRNELCRDYLYWLRWRMSQDRQSTDDVGEARSRTGEGEPDPRPGDRAWRRQLRPAVMDPESESGTVGAMPDLRDFVLVQLSLQRPTFRLEELRGSWLPRPTSRCRARVIRSAARRGFRTGQIAKLFGLTPSAVSTIRHASSRLDDGLEPPG